MSKSKQPPHIEDSLFCHEILAHMAEGLTLVRADDLSIVYANPKIEKMFGYSPGEIIGKNVSILNASTEKNLKEIVAEINIALADGKTWCGEIENIKKDGTHFWCVANVSSFDHPQYGQVFLSINTDITERKGAEIKLAEEKAFLRTIIDSAEDFIYLKDRNSIYIGCNKASEDFIGLAESEQIGKSDFDFFDKAQAEIILKNDQTIFEHRKAVRTEDLVVSPSGEQIILDTVKAPIVGPDGQIIGLVGISRDITERIQSQKELQESEKRYQDMFGSMVQPVALHEIICDDSGTPIDYRFLDVNPAFEQLFGKSAKEIITKTVLELMPETEAYWIETYGKVALTGESTHFENYSKELDCYFHVVAYSPTKGQFAVVANDITENKRAEKNLRLHQDLLEKAQSLGHIGTWQLDIKKNLLIWTDENCRIFGVPPGTAANYEFFLEKVHPEDRDYVNQAWTAGIEGKPYDIEHRVVVNGETKWVREKADLFFDEQGHATSATGFTQDITESKKIREELAQVAHEWQTTFDATNDAIWILDADNRVLRSNKAAELMFHSRSEDILGDHCWSIVHQTECPPEGCPFEKSKESGRRETMEFQDGGHWFRVIVDPIFDLNGQHSGAAHIVSDITASKLAEDALKNSEERFRQLVENAPDAIFVRDKECFTYLNNASLKLFGASSQDELIGTPIIERYHPESRDKIRNRMALLNDERKEAPLTQSVCLQMNGTEIDVESTAVPINFEGEEGALIFLRDITDRIEENNRRQHLEEQLHQSQKIESLGRLAGGVAHDYNNMLSVIIGNVELAQMKAKRSAPVDDNLEQIIQAANRSKDITRQLLAFARKQIIDPKVLDLNVAVENMLKMLGSLLGENIELRWQPKEDLWPVKLDPSQLDQVLANLCINARDAITDIGKMTIETDTVSFDEEYCEDHPGFTRGDYVLLSVSDDGRGMDKETLDNIFEPFFTTKQLGEGTGLGMATVYGIVKQSGGFIYAYSEPNQGTTFKIYIPRHEGEDAIAQKTAIGGIQKGQGETVLLVEDEAAIVEMTKAMLEDMGYQVLATHSPDEALNLLQEYQGDIHLILTDVVMPGMNGKELAKQIMETHPKIKALFMSGYTADIIAHHGVLDEDLNFIQKPFSRRDLSLCIRKIFDSNS